MNKTFKRIITVAVAVMMIFAMVSCASIKKPVNKLEGKFSGKTVILHDNDVHGAVEGYAYMAYLKQYFENLGATVVVVSDGDFSQGSLYVSLSKGLNAVKLLDAVGYDIVGLGNHELDYGMEQLKSNVKDAKFKTVCSNVYDEKGKTIFDEYAIVKVGNLKIGFFGLETPETQTKVNPGLIKGVKFATTAKDAEFNLYDVAQKEINKLNKKADIVICLGHLGVDEESVAAACRSVDVWSKVSGLDFLIDGHSHTVMETGSKGEPIQSTGTAFENIGVIVIDNATKTIADHYLVPTKAIGKDLDVLNVAKGIIADVDNEYNAVFAKSLVELDGSKPGNRSMESNMGDLIADSMIWSVLQGGSIDVDNDHVVAITNGGGIRATIKAGDVSKAAVNLVLPFGNTIAVDYVTGAELLEALEASTYCAPAAVGGFPQVAGINFTVDTKVPYDQGKQYPGSTYFGPNSIKRVTIKDINGKPFNANDTYAVITNNFCAAGGDTYYSLFRAYEAGQGFDTQIPLDVALMDYISEVLGGTIGTDYAKAQGRIVLK